MDRTAAGAGVPVQSVDELAAETLAAQLPGVQLPPPPVTVRVAGGAPDTIREAFDGIDRSVAPSLQHVATPRPIDAELIREARDRALASGRGIPLADGTKPGTERSPVDAAFLAAVKRQLDRDDGSGGAQRDRALDLLDRVERLVARIGGFMRPEDQDLMREVRAALAESGRRVDERPLWTDRR